MYRALHGKGKSFSSTGCSATYWQAVPPPAVIRSRNFPSLWQKLHREPSLWIGKHPMKNAGCGRIAKSTQSASVFQFSLLVIASEQTNRMWLCGSECKNGLQSQKAINKSRCRPRPNQKPVIGPAPIFPEIMQAMEGGEDNLACRLRQSHG